MSPHALSENEENFWKKNWVLRLGYVPKVEDCVIESRHLGLVLPDEIPELKDRLHKLAGVLEETLDIDRILELAGEAPDLLDAKPESVTDFRLSEPVRIGVARMRRSAFSMQTISVFWARWGQRLFHFHRWKISSFRMIWTGFCYTAAIRN